MMNMDIPLSKQLRLSSRRIHNVSDALVNARLAALLTDRTLYGRAIANFYCIFDHLERHLVEVQLDQGVVVSDHGLVRFFSL
jgi:hypothetical protein